MMITKMPLATYVLYHSDFTEGEACFNKIYQLLCRDIERPLTDGIDIPVYACVGSDDLETAKIHYDDSDKVAIIVLIDEKMFCSKYWRDYLQTLSNKLPNNAYIYSVGLCEYAFEICPELNKFQGIVLSDYSFENNWSLIEMRLLESLFRLMTNPAQKVRLFISHAKKDCVDVAKMFRDHLNQNTKLGSFFDENDILDGNDFAKQLENGVENSLLVVFNSDVYSEREWCRNEMLIAKKYDVPLVVVNCVQRKVKRLFPYVGNCPMIQYRDEEWDEIILTLLKVALNQVYQKQLLFTIQQEHNVETSIPYAPEPYTFTKLDKQKKMKVLYPEPPLGTEEKEVLLRFNEKIEFLTPTEAVATNLANCINGAQIAFSVSDTTDIQNHGGSNIMLKDVVLELSRYILKSGGFLVYGGDLRQNGFTKAFEEFSYQYGQKEKTGLGVTYFTNYFAWPNHLRITEKDRMEFIHHRVNTRLVTAPVECKDENIFLPPFGSENLYIWAKSLTKMRNEMESNVDARIIIGGRLQKFKGKYAGVVEEFLIAANENHPIYLIGGFGGAARAIADIIDKKNMQALQTEAFKGDDYQDFVEYYNQTSVLDQIDYDDIVNRISTYEFDNGLSVEENKRLYYTTNVLEIVSLVLKGLNNKFNN